MQQYIDLIKAIIDNGQIRNDRTGIGTKSIFGTQLRFNLENGFPAVTSKKLAWKSVVSELLWFLSGSSNERDLCEILHGTRDETKRTIWTDNYENQGKSLGYSDGELGPVYGKQWRSWEGLKGLHGPKKRCYLISKVDQISNVIENIKNDPFSRRHIVNAWNVSQLPEMALPPCHMMFQFYVIPDSDGNPEKLSLMWYQRSVDVGLGLPFNIASYALLLCIIAKICNLKPYEVIFTGGDTHVYLNHIDTLQEQCKQQLFELPTLQMPEFSTLDEVLKLKVDDFKLLNYKCNKTIKMKMAI